MGALPSVVMRRLRRETFGGPQASAAGAWIGLDLRRGRGDRLGRQETEARVPAADADRELRGTNAAPPLGGEEALDDPILERVVAEDDDATSRTEQVEGRRQPVLEGIELFVDRDPQCLEDTGRRVRSTRMTPSRVSSSRRPAERVDWLT